MAQHNNPDDLEHTIRMEPEPYPLDDLADLLNADSLSPEDDMPISSKAASSDTSNQTAAQQEPIIPPVENKQVDIPYVESAASNQDKPTHHKASSKTPYSIKQLLPIGLALIIGFIAIGLNIFTQSQIQALQERPQTTPTTALDMQEIKLLHEKIQQQQQQITQLQSQHTKLALQQQAMLAQQLKARQISMLHKAATPPPIAKKITSQHQTVTAVQPFQSHLTTHTGSKHLKKPWTVIIASFQSLAAAKHKQQQLKNIQTKIVQTHIKGSIWYRLIATGFKTHIKAQSFISHLKQQGIKDAWVQSNP